MNSPKLLIDTNIVIGLEDHKQISDSFSSLQQKCSAHSVQLWVHEASRQDVARDKNDPRKTIISSKLGKFQELKGIPNPKPEELSAVYGPIRKPNDYIDTLLLHALHGVGAVDFLVTEDRGVHKRAESVGIGNRVFTVNDALAWLKKQYERESVSLPLIEEKQCHQLNRDAPIFESLRNDYDGFDTWFQESCIRKHRDCWTINIDEQIAGIAIRKDESFAELTAKVPSATAAFSNTPSRILKICTFKIGEEQRGEKFGEQLLKQVLWWAHKNSYEVVYLTVFPKHKPLVDLLFQYGFESIGRSAGELYLAKAFAPGINISVPPDDALAYHRKYYPGFKDDESVQKYLIPIKPPYYSTLFPENVRKRQPGLFEAAGVPLASRIPGNTIRKVYVCHTPTTSIRVGDLLFFYHVQDHDSVDSQSLVTLGVVDGFDVTDKNEELLRLTAKRSVFDPAELERFTKGNTKKVKVINFLLAGHLSPSITYSRLETLGLKGPYQSIRSVPEEVYNKLRQELSLHV